MSRKQIARDAAFMVGSVSLLAGVGMVYLPAAFIIAGLGLITLSIRGV